MSSQSQCVSHNLKCFIQFTFTNLDGSQKEGGNFFNLFQKEGGTQKEGQEGSLRKGGVPALEEIMVLLYSFTMSSTSSVYTFFDTEVMYL